MRSQPSTPAAPAPQVSAGVAARAAVAGVGWRVEGPSAALRAVPDLVRGHLVEVRYAVLLAPA